MTAPSAEAPEQVRARFSEVVLAIYAAITLLGVIAAASWKNLFTEYHEIFVIIIGTTITVGVAHVWATIAAQRLVYQRPMSLSERRHELRGFASILFVGLLAATALMVTWTITDDLESAVRSTLGMLIAVLFIVGVVGSRRRGSTWPRSLGWGFADASIGIAVLAAKILVGS